MRWRSRGWPERTPLPKAAKLPREELANFCHRMTEKRRSIRQTKGIKPPRMRCPKCGQASRSDISSVSIRSVLFALKNSGGVTAAEFKELDRS